MFDDRSRKSETMSTDAVCACSLILEPEKPRLCSFISLCFYVPFVGFSKGVGFIRFDQRNEAERAIQELNGKVPKGCTEPITVKFANNPSNNAKALPPLAAAYLTPQATRRFAGALPAGRFRLDPVSLTFTICFC